MADNALPIDGAEAPQQTPPQSARDKYVGRLKKKYPDKKFEDDEEIYAQANEDYDSYDKDIEGYKGREKSLSDMFAANPQSAYYLNDMRNGGDPAVGLVKRFGIEIRDVLDDPDMQDKIAEANKEYMERVAKSRELDEKYEKNLDKTLKELDSYQSEKGLDDAGVDKLTALWLTIVSDGVMGVISRETLDMLSNAVNHDQDVASASEEGQVAGRNAKITEQLRKPKKGDGTQPLDGKNTSPSRQTGGSLFELAKQAM
jgi:hypothetical protein